MNSADEEKTEILGFVDELNAADKIFAVQLVLNLDCNLACGYCFEGSRKGKFYMSRETANRFIEFVKKILSPDKEEIRINFYGGEPLLSMDLILFVSNAIKSFAFEKGMKYTGRLVTNGTLLTPQAAAKLQKSGIKAASITLDGPESVHDASRPFRGGKGSFRAIIKT